MVMTMFGIAKYRIVTNLVYFEVILNLGPAGCPYFILMSMGGVRADKEN